MDLEAIKSLAEKADKHEREELEALIEWAKEGLLRASAGACGSARHVDPWQRMREILLLVSGLWLAAMRGRISGTIDALRQRR